MSRELMILRHGKSDWDSGAADDYHRPLAKRGRKAVKRMAEWLREHARLPARIVSSPATRARETTQRLCRHAGLAESIVIWEEAVYGADVPTLLQVLAEHGDDARGDIGDAPVLLVGHNPGLEDLVIFLAGAPIDAPAGRSALPTAALVQMELPADWRALDRGCARLLTVIRPGELAGP